MPLIGVLYTEPHGSVCQDRLRCLVRGALGCHPTRRPGTARACRRFDYGPCREVPHDPHGHEEACRRLGAGGARHHGEGRARADLQARPAPAGGRGGMDREAPPALERTLRRVGQGCRGIETEGESKWTKEEKVRPPPRRTARGWSGSPSANSSSHAPSTRLRASCSRRGPRQNYSGGGGYQNRMGKPCFPAKWMFALGGSIVWCFATKIRRWSSTARTSK